MPHLHVQCDTSKNLVPDLNDVDEANGEKGAAYMNQSHKKWLISDAK